MLERENEIDVGDDLLWGVKAIATFIDRTNRQTTYLLENGKIPAGKVGRFWVASKKRNRDHFASLTSAKAD